MQCAALVLQFGIGSDGISDEHRAQMVATDVDAHADLARTERHGSYAGKVLAKGQRSATGEETKRLTVEIVDFHACHAGVGLLC